MKFIWIWICRKEIINLECSFCGKNETIVKHLIVAVGKGVCICDECVIVCQETITKALKEDKEKVE